jgi:5,10-methylenetetrahydromethanopterin reductase
MNGRESRAPRADGLVWGVGTWQSETPSEFVSLVHDIERLGYHQLWHGNHKLYRDMFMGLMLAACHSERLQLGSFIAEPYTMHPALIAAAIGTLDEASGGRAVLGLGAGGANFKEIGVQRLKPVMAMREAIEIIRRLLHGEMVTLHGQVFMAEDAELQFKPRPNIPIVLASRGDRVLELGGQMADTVMIATYAQPRGIRHALERVAQGAQAAGRRMEDVGIIARVDACVWPDGQVARDAVKPMIAGFLMSSYPDKGFVHQMGLEIPEPLEEILKQKNEALTYSSWRLVPDDFVDAFSWAGTPEEVARQVADVIKLGINQITFLPQPPAGQGVAPVVRLWMEEVAPRVRQLVGE